MQVLEKKRIRKTNSMKSYNLLVTILSFIYGIFVGAIGYNIPTFSSVWIPYMLIMIIVARIAFLIVEQWNKS